MLRKFGAVLRIAVITALVIIWWQLRQRTEDETETTADETIDQIELDASQDETVQDLPMDAWEASPPAAPAADYPAGEPTGEGEAEEAPVEPQNLRRIEGIGPKISEALYQAGIQTYAQLAALTPEEIRETLKSAGVRIANPQTWPEQAALADLEEWESLERLQTELKGGRRV